MQSTGEEPIRGFIVTQTDGYETYRGFAYVEKDVVHLAIDARISKIADESPEVVAERLLSELIIQGRVPPS